MNNKISIGIIRNGEQVKEIFVTPQMWEHYEFIDYLEIDDRNRILDTYKAPYRNIFADLQCMVYENTLDL